MANTMTATPLSRSPRLPILCFDGCDLRRFGLHLFCEIVYLEQQHFGPQPVLLCWHFLQAFLRPFRSPCQGLALVVEGRNAGLRCSSSNRRAPLHGAVQAL